MWELSKTGQFVTPINEPHSTESKCPQNLYLVRHRGVHYDCVFEKKWNHCSTQTRCLLKGNNKMKAIGMKTLKSGTITAEPMELDGDKALDRESTNTHDVYVEADLMASQSHHQTRMSGLPKPPP